MRFLLSAGLISCLILQGQGELVAADYLSEIKPLLKRRCVSCHGPIKQKAGLRLDGGEWVMKGGKNGSVVEKGNSGASALFHRISSHDEEERMPPEGAALAPGEIAALVEWIDQGARFPETEETSKSPRDHWSFQPVKRPRIPEVQDEKWSDHPIDRFVWSQLAKRDWEPAQQAEPAALLRRVYLDLIGFPPTVEEQAAFEQSPDLEAVIDDLLSRRGYGERWGRHWLDVVRYADTNGYERDAIKPFVWRYRDWVIDALNDDLPYDRFVIEQLAGDELSQTNADTLIATTYLRLGPWDDEPADPATDRYDQLDDLLNTTSQAMLGLTLACARCHDHKFEPLSQEDYYSMIAIFDPLERPRRGRSELAIPAGTREEIAALKQRDLAIARIEMESSDLRNRFERTWLESGQSGLPGEVAAAFLSDPKKQTAEQKSLVKAKRQSLDKAIDSAMPDALKEELSARTAQIEALKAGTPDLPLAYRWEEPDNAPDDTHLLIRGQPGRHGEVMSPRPPQLLLASLPAHMPEPGDDSTRRRLGLARWIASPDNPLTARVIVNRVWQHHFGEGLVRTLNDFGMMGESPTHPELLDWLASWFVNEGGWSLKKLHRLILTSRTWQMSNRYENRQYQENDPENRWLWRQNYRRLEVEAIRDSILAVSGQLNREMYGPHTYPSIPPQALEGHSDPGKIWQPLDEKSASRRTIYAYVKRSLMLPMLEVFDLCDTTQPSPGRRVSTVAPQALTLYNGEFVNRQARHFAERLRREAGLEPSDQIELAYRVGLCRGPSAGERQASMAFIEQESLEEFCRVFFNLNEFVYPD